MHIAVDALGNPVEFILTGGQEADVAQGEPLVNAHKAEAYILDKAYDSDAIVAAAQRQGGEAVIPPKRNRKWRAITMSTGIRNATRWNGSST